MNRQLLRPSAFRRSSLAACLLAFVAACNTGDKKETQVAPLSPALSPAPTPAAQAAPTSPSPAVIGKAAEPGAVSELALLPDSSKLGISMAKITKRHEGSFSKLSGSATLSGEQVQSVNFSVDVSSLQTDAEKLTEHMKSPDFLDVAKFPTATFKSTSVVAKPSGAATHEVSGELTLHGVTQPITFPATVDVTPETVTGRAEVPIDRQKFGVTYPGMPDDLIKDEVVLKPVLVFSRKQS